MGFIFLLTCVLFMTSCEKPDGETEFINTNEKEGFTDTIIDGKMITEKGQNTNM